MTTFGNFFWGEIYLKLSNFFNNSQFSEMLVRLHGHSYLIQWCLGIWRIFDTQKISSYYFFWSISVPNWCKILDEFLWPLNFRLLILLNWKLYTNSTPFFFVLFMIDRQSSRFSWTLVIANKITKTTIIRSQWMSPLYLEFENMISLFKKEKYLPSKTYHQTKTSEEKRKSFF